MCDTSATGRSRSTPPSLHANSRATSMRRSAYHARMRLSATTARMAWSRASSHFSLLSLSTCCKRCRRCPSCSARSASCLNSPTFCTLFSGMSISIPACCAAVEMSCSFLTVSLPICSSLLTWSSTLGMSTLPAVRVLRVATTKPSEMACLICSLGCSSGSRARTSSLKGGLRPDRMASLLSVTCRSGRLTLPRAKGRTTRPWTSLLPPEPHTSRGVFFFLLSSSAHCSRSSSDSVFPSRILPPSRNLVSYRLPSSMNSSSFRSGTSSSIGRPVLRSTSSMRMLAPHLALRTSLTRYLRSKLTMQRRLGLC
mmetsp:Transcript_35719/g.79456  ORF Transcript_35719/g.79456 Transcript_35719/m.79456 type:complete len:311 (+) Transcript_35719:657-1589(+)